MSVTLWEEQKPAYEFAIGRNEVALFCEQRTGKTFLTLAILKKLAGTAIDWVTGKGNDFAGVLVCLLTNRDSTWLDQLRDKLKWLNVTTDWDDFKKLPSPRLFVVHFEGLPKVIKKMVKYRRINWMCIDEAHRIARRSSKLSRAAARMSWVSRKMILTGTPIEKQPKDLWAQFRFLAPSVFGTRWEDFENEYMEFDKIDIKAPPGSKQWQLKILQQRILRSRATFRKSKLVKLTRLIQPYAYRLTKSDVGIIEPEVHKVIVSLSDRRYYEDMRKHSVIRLPDGSRAIAELEVTNIMKRRQIASGFIYDDEDELHYIGHDKLDHLMGMVRKLPKPLVVFAAFRPDVDRITRSLSRKRYDVIAVHGGINKKKRPDIWRSFQRSEYDVIVCQTRTGGVGVDLWKASHAIVYSMGHSFIDFDQLKSRLDSKLKNKPAKIWVLCGSRTIDEDIYELVIEKRLSGEEVLSQLKRRMEWQRKPRRSLRRGSSTTGTASTRSPRKWA